MSLLARRLARLARSGSPAAVARAARRELASRRGAAELERGLASGRPIVVGPFLGEVGYELLYWRPAVLRLLRARGVERDRVVVLSRGGAGAWYAGVAGRALDAFELMTPDEVRRGMAERVARTGQRKQVDVDALDLELFGRARDELGEAVLLHPVRLYRDWSMRYVWEGLVAPEEAPRHGDYDDLPRGDVDEAIARRLPEGYVAVKAYFNECLPAAAATREGLLRLVERIAAAAPVVLLEAGTSVDDHVDWDAAGVDVVSIADVLEPTRNLAQQAAIVARADALVSTYGGFSYLGPFLGVPTVALAARPEANPHHERVLRAVRPGADYRRVELAGAAAAVMSAVEPAARA